MYKVTVETRSKADQDCESGVGGCKSSFLQSCQDFDVLVGSALALI